MKALDILKQIQEKGLLSSDICQRFGFALGVGVLRINDSQRPAPGRRRGRGKARSFARRFRRLQICIRTGRYFRFGVFFIAPD